MSWVFSWVGIKRDQRGKNHIYGRIVRAEDAGLSHPRYYRVHGMVSGDKPYIHISEHYFYYDNSRITRSNKMKGGYKEYTTEQIQNSLPLVVQEINSQFLLMKLKNGN